MAEGDRNKAAVHQFYEEVVAAGHIELLESLVAPDVFDHGAEQMGWPAGREGFRHS